MKIKHSSILTAAAIAALDGLSAPAQSREKVISDSPCGGVLVPAQYTSPLHAQFTEKWNKAAAENEIARIAAAEAKRARRGTVRN